MVFGWLFGKKKANEQAQQQPLQQQQQEPQVQATQRVPAGVSKSKDQKHQMPKLPQREDTWIYEYLLQYLTSPLWKVPIYDFLDENCIVFDDEEENKFSYTQIHKKFKVMIEQMIETLMAEIGVDESTMLYYIEIGLKTNAHKKVFEQLLIVDNFLVFKKLMVKRNKELELEALKELMNEEGGQAPQPEEAEKLKIATLQAERAEIEHAIQASMAAEEQLRKMHEAEDEDLRRVLEMSKLSYDEEQSRSKIHAEQQEQKKKAALELEQQIEKQKAQAAQEAQAAQAAQQAAQQAALAQQQAAKSEPVQPEKVSPTKKEQPAKKPEEQKEMTEFKPLQKLPVLKPLSNLPPLIEKKYEKPVEDLLNDRMQLMKQLDTYKAAEDKIKNEKAPEKKVEEPTGESLEERKQRLLAQRELLRKKKQQQREKELTEYKETGEVGKKNISSQQSVLLSEGGYSENLTPEELQKRQALISKIKQNM